MYLASLPFALIKNGQKSNNDAGLYYSLVDLKLI